MYVRYNCTPKTTFVTLKALQKADAESIYKAIKFDLNILNWKEKLVSGCFDGASVNMGCSWFTAGEQHNKYQNSLWTVPHDST